MEMPQGSVRQYHKGPTSGQDEFIYLSASEVSHGLPLHLKYIQTAGFPAADTHALQMANSLSL